MSTNHWKSFKIFGDKPEQLLEKSLSGGKYLGLGDHTVKIEAVEAKETARGVPYVVVTYVNDEGKTTQDSLFLVGEDKNGNMFYTSSYKDFAQALTDRLDLKYKFFVDFLPETTERFTTLVGLTLGIKIVQDDKGFVVEKVGDLHRLVDVQTKEPLELSDNIPNEFTSVKDALDLARSQKLKRAWNRVSTFFPVPEEVSNNTTALELILQNHA